MFLSDFFKQKADLFLIVLPIKIKKLISGIFSPYFNLKKTWKQGF